MSSGLAEAKVQPVLTPFLANVRPVFRPALAHLNERGKKGEEMTRAYSGQPQNGCRNRDRQVGGGRAGLEALCGRADGMGYALVAQERGRRGRRRRRERRWHAATLETSAGPKQITTMLGHFVDVSARGCVAGDLCCLELLAVTKEVRRPACVFIAERWHWVQKLF